MGNNKKVVNIITIHKEPNYGAALQAFALYETVKRLGGNPRIINLSMDYRRLRYNPINRILIRIKNIVRGYDVCFRKIEGFSNTYCPNQIGNFHSFEELQCHEWNRDETYIVGSDQVWNPDITGNLSDAYTLSFLGKEYTYKYSYASSFGNIKDAAQQARQIDLESLRSFKRIAVREQFGVEFLKTYGIDAVETIDPTLLLEDYSFLFNRPLTMSKRILFLSLSDTEPMNYFVDSIAHRMNLPVEKHYGYLQPNRAENARFMDVTEWLYKIATSELVITDSFHATVFSILFKRPFYVYISEPSKIHRISSILNLLNIHGKIVTNPNDMPDEQSIDYDDVTIRLAKYRKHSLEYLQSIISAK